MQKTTRKRRTARPAFKAILAKVYKVWGELFTAAILLFLTGGWLFGKYTAENFLTLMGTFVTGGLGVSQIIKTLRQLDKKNDTESE